MTAYLLLENEEYANPRYYGVTLDKAVAEDWKKKRPVSFDATTWNSYVPLNFIDKVMEMALCETEMVFLKPNLLYKFNVMPSCKRCKEIEEEYSKK